MNLLTIGAGILALLSTGGQASPRPHTDQTVTVSRGARLLVNAFAGEVKVHAWERDAIRVQADHSVRDSIDIKTTEALITIRPQSSMGAPRSIDLDITMPSWMRLDSGTRSPSRSTVPSRRSSACLASRPRTTSSRPRDDCGCRQSTPLFSRTRSPGLPPGMPVGSGSWSASIGQTTPMSCATPAPTSSLRTSPS